MKTHSIIFMSMLMAGLAMTSCSKDDSPKQEGIPAEKTYTDSNGLKLTYDGAPMPGKSVTFIRDEKDLPHAQLVMGSVVNFPVVALSNGETVTPNPIPGPGVIPGSPKETLSLSLSQSGDADTFSGTADSRFCTYAYKGFVSADGLTLAISDVKLKDTRICGAWGLPAYTVNESTHLVTDTPIHLVWDSSAQIDFNGKPLTIDGLLQMIMAMPLLQNHTMSIPDMLALMLKQVRFGEDGNITASYIDMSGKAPALKNTAPNLLQYVLAGDSNLLLYPNYNAGLKAAADLINKINEEMMASLTRSGATGGATGGTTGGTPSQLDALKILQGILSQLTPMLAEGLSLTYNLQGDRLDVYLDSRTLLPIMKNVLLPLLQDKQLMNSLLDVLGADPDLADLVKILPTVIKAADEIIAGTTRLEVGLRLVKAS